MNAPDQYRQNLHSLNRLDVLLTPTSVDRFVKISAVTRSAVRRPRSTEVMQEEVVQRIRIERIKQAQEEESWIANLKEILIGDTTKLSIEEASYVLGSRSIMTLKTADYCFSARDRPKV